MSFRVWSAIPIDVNFKKNNCGTLSSFHPVLAKCLGFDPVAVHRTAGFADAFVCNRYKKRCSIELLVVELLLNMANHYNLRIEVVLTQYIWNIYFFVWYLVRKPNRNICLENISSQWCFDIPPPNFLQVDMCVNSGITWMWEIGRSLDYLFQFCLTGLCQKVTSLKCVHERAL